MTDKEMAEEYAKGLCKTCKVDVCRHSTIQTCAIKESLEQAYLAGLKAGRPKWHKVADGDLPPKTTLVLIKACGCFILGWLDDNDVWHNDSDNGARIPKENIIAWKEIVLPVLPKENV